MFLHDFLAMLREVPWIFYSLVAILALCLGSFLNVLIFRMPVALMQRWKAECYNFLDMPNHAKPSKFMYGLVFPSSHCPKCNHAIRVYDNVPLISYLFLGGKCRDCKKRISLRYPFIEYLAAILCLTVAFKYNVTWQALAGCVFTLTLISQATIDIDHTLIPDEITLPMLWLGLLLSTVPVFADSHSAIIGATLGYLFLWATYWLFYFITGKEGMGYGDFKLLAMIGAWLGWQLLLFVILFASVVGAVIGVTTLLITKKSYNTRIPFGPFLAAGGWLALICGREVTSWYLYSSGSIF